MDYFKEGFKKLGLPIEQLSDYESADKFASRFEKVSILRDDQIHYSPNSTFVQDNNQIEKESASYK